VRKAHEGGGHGGTWKRMREPASLETVYILKKKKETLGRRRKGDEQGNETSYKRQVKNEVACYSVLGRGRAWGKKKKKNYGKLLKAIIGPSKHAILENGWGGGERKYAIHKEGKEFRTKHGEELGEEELGEKMRQQKPKR